MGNSVIVTGGAGFIGCNLIKALNERDVSNITVVDQLGSGEKWRNLRGLRVSDVRDKEDFLADVLRDRVEAPDVLFHMGACSSTTEKDADYLLRNNYRYTRHLVEWATRTGMRLILASSAATYGDGSLGYSDEDAVTPTLRPLNMYGFSKQLLDAWALDRGHYNRMVGLKFFNVFGPCESHKGEMRSVVHKAHQQILSTGSVTLFRSGRPDYRDGEQKRDFIHVKDAVAVALHFMDHPDINGLFNCGTGKARTWLDLVRAIFTAMGRPPRIEFIDMPPALAATYQYFTEADVSKLRRVGGFRQEFTPLEAGVAGYVRALEK